MAILYYAYMGHRNGTLFIHFCMTNIQHEVQTFHGFVKNYAGLVGKCSLGPPSHVFNVTVHTGRAQSGVGAGRGRVVPWCCILHVMVRHFLAK